MDRGYDVTLSRTSTDQSWGFGIAGGLEHRKPLSITQVKPDSPAKGKLDVGWIITSINGFDVTHAKHVQANFLIKNAASELVLTFHRYQSVAGAKPPPEG